MKLGKTIVGERESVQTESERMLERKKEKKRKKLSIAIVLMFFVLIGISITAVVMNFINDRKEDDQEVTVVKYTPSVEIIDEDGNGYITDRMSQYVGRIERDFKDLGYTVTKAIVPAGKAREIDIYLNGRNEYYKCNLDRGTAETAEDAVRMREYLNSHDLYVSYVDVRLAGRAYYKETARPTETQAPTENEETAVDVSTDESGENVE